MNICQKSAIIGFWRCGDTFSEMIDATSFPYSIINCVTEFYKIELAEKEKTTNLN